MPEPLISSFPRSKQNDKRLSDFGAFIADDFMCTPAIETDTWGGVGRNSFIVTNQTVGMQKIKFSIVYEERSYEKGVLDLSQWPIFKYDDITRETGKLILDEYPTIRPELNKRAQIEYNIRMLEKLMLNKITLIINDGYEYHCALKNISNPVWHGDCFCVKEYTFIGYKTLGYVRKDMSDVINSKGTFTIDCNSTVPKTDCRITIDGAADAALARKIVKVGKLVFDSHESLAYPLVLDGINGRLLSEGNNSISQFVWTDFPYLVPGENIISISQGALKRDVSFVIEYYPTFI